ncbi:MAG: tautomerase [Aquificota bacterium]|nr:MAG: tautomerase [Aquificota bacterium]
MPFVNIKIARNGVTQEQKARLIRGVTDLIQEVEVLGKSPSSVMVMIEELDPEDVGLGGETVAEKRRRKP